MENINKYQLKITIKIYRSYRPLLFIINYVINFVVDKG